MVRLHGLMLVLVLVLVLLLPVISICFVLRVPWVMVGRRRVGIHVVVVATPRSAQVW